MKTQGVSNVQDTKILTTEDLKVVHLKILPILVFI